MTGAEIDEALATPYHPDELAQMRRFAAWSFADKVRWLEEAHRLALALQQAPRRPVGGGDGASLTGPSRASE